MYKWLYYGRCGKCGQQITDEKYEDTNHPMNAYILKTRHSEIGYAMVCNRCGWWFAIPKEEYIDEILGEYESIPCSKYRWLILRGLIEGQQGDFWWGR